MKIYSSPASTLARIAERAILALTLSVLIAPAAMAGDIFDCYEGCADDLETSVCVDNPGMGDYHTSCSGAPACPDAGSDVTVLAIHGGNIERHTDDIATELAGLFGWNLYTFDAHLVNGGACRALEEDGNPSNDHREVLHVTGTGYNHGEALTLVGAHPHAVSIHGCGASCSDETICIGGRNTAQVDDLEDYIADYKHLLPYNVFGAHGAFGGNPLLRLFHWRSGHHQHRQPHLHEPRPPVGDEPRCTSRFGQWPLPG